MPKLTVNCSQCESELERYPLNPVTKKPIKNFFCNKQCKGKWQTKQRELLGFTREWLENEYLVIGKSANQIAREIGRDSKRVWEWIRDYGIETRSRGHNTDHLPKDGSTWLGRNHSEETKENMSKLAIADGRLPWGKHNEPYWKGKNGSLHPSFKGGLTPERQQVYSSNEWINSVKEVWKRDNAFCQKCGKNHNEEQNRGNFHIHHIVSFMVRELRTEVDNLVLLCKECHKFVHSKNNINKEFIKEI